MTNIEFENLTGKLCWNEQGLIPVITQEIDGTVLMFAWMNAISLRMTIEERVAVYFSRSRQEIWRKGDTSGNKQELVSIHIDCDCDVVLIKVKQTGVACHTGMRSCFYRNISEEGAFDHE